MLAVEPSFDDSRLTHALAPTRAHYPELRVQLTLRRTSETARSRPGEAPPLPASVAPQTPPWSTSRLPLAASLTANVVLATVLLLRRRRLAK
jgi:hypothetical protein